MNLLAFGGRLIAGTLPAAQVFAMRDRDDWIELGRVDWTPDVMYRRAASMAIHRGMLMVGTLPSGRVHALRLGTAVSTGRSVASGRHEIMAVRRGPRLELHIDGGLVASEAHPEGLTLDLGVLPPMSIGSGPRASFRGEVDDVRFERGAANAPGANGE
jgi:hypothetical protein